MPCPNGPYPHVKAMTIRKDKSWGRCREAIMKQRGSQSPEKGSKKRSELKDSFICTTSGDTSNPSSGIFLSDATWNRGPVLVPPLQQVLSPTPMRDKDQILTNVFFIPKAKGCSRI